MSTDDSPKMVLLQSCPHGCVHLRIGSVTLHMSSSEFRLMLEELLIQLPDISTHPLAAPMSASGGCLNVD